MLTKTSRNLLFRLGQLGALAVMAVLGVSDLNMGLAGAGAGLALLQVLSAMATAAVWLPRHKQGSTRLPKVAFLLACASLLLTIIVAAAGPTHGSFGAAEALGLLGVLFVVSRRGDPPWSVGAVIATVVAVGFLPLRGGVSYFYVISGLVLGLGAAVAIGAGVYLRTIESGRKRAMDTVRAEQRAEFAATCTISSPTMSPASWCRRRARGSSPSRIRSGCCSRSSRSSRRAPRRWRRCVAWWACCAIRRPGPTRRWRRWPG
jgi:hypothetical protein